MRPRVQLPEVRGWLCGALVVAVLGAGLVACKREPPPAAPVAHAPASTPAQSASPVTPVDNRQSTAVPSARVPSTPPAPAASGRTDLDITNDVRRAIAGEPTLSAAAKQVLVTTTEGVVQLSGTLPTEADRENLRVAVNRVAGVKSIDNRTIVRK